jgi:hypothetical protein
MAIFHCSEFYVEFHSQMVLLVAPENTVDKIRDKKCSL